jgi:hypothetical protein
MGSIASFARALTSFVAGLVLAGIAMAADEPPRSAPKTVNGCPIDRSWEDDVLQSVLGVSAETLQKLHDIRGLAPWEICTIAPEKLARALAKVDQPKPDHPGEAVAFRAMQQWSDNRRVRPDGLVNALLERSLISISRPGADLAGITRTSWAAIGPSNIGGRLRSVLTHPTDPNSLLVGSVSGGIWRTADGGASWAPVDDFMPNVAIDTLVRDPSNPQRIYAGTGEGFYNGDSIRGYGVFVSNDGGTTWAQLPGTVPDVRDPPVLQTADFALVNRIAVHPTNPNIVLVATSGYYCNWGGLYRTTNALAANPTWTLVYDRRVLDVQFDPANGNNVVVGEGAHCPPPAFNLDGGGVAYSTNGGASFTRVALDTTPQRGRVEVAWAPATPGLVVAVTEGNGGAGASGRFWFSTNGGQTWTLNSQPGHLSSQGWYNNSIWVDPTNSGRVVVGGLDVYRGAGAANWWTINSPVAWTKITAWATPTSVHADNHAIVHATNYNGTSNRIVYIGNDGGIYRSNDIALHNGSDFSTGWVNLNNGLQVTQFYSGAGKSGMTGGITRIVGGTQDNGSLRAPNSGLTWSTFFGGDGGFSAIDPVDPNYYYGEYVYASIHRATGGGNSTIICGGPNPITQGANGVCSPTATNEANFIAPFVLDPNNVNTMLVGARSLWRSTDVKAATPHWFTIKNPNPTQFNYISAVAVAPTDSNIIWVGHNRGELYCTINGTAATPTWTQLSPTPNLRMVLRIMIDPSNPNRVLVTYGGYNSGNVLELTDASQVCKSNPTVTDRHGNLPQAPVRSIVRHATNPAWLYVGTEVGIFATTNGGASWSTTNDGPGSVSVDEIFWLNANTLVAATHGRGMFRATLAPTGAVRRDFNGDSKSDLPWRSTSGQTALWLMNGTSASSSALVFGDPAWTVTHIGDLSGDGKADLLWLNAGTGQTAAWIMNGTTLTSAAVLLTDPNWRIDRLADTDGDGNRDIVWRNTASGATALWRMTGTTAAGSAMLSVDPNWRVTHIGDFNGDGKADLLWRNTATGATAMWLMNGLAPTSAVILFSDPAWQVAHVGDFDGDGRSDLLWRNASTGQVATWLMNGVATTSSGVILTSADWQPAFVGDFNGDGRSDIVWTNAVTGAKAMWLQNGLATTSSAILIVDANWTPTHTDDYNGDGKADIAWRNTSTGATAIWLMNGTGLLGAAIVLTNPAWTVSPAQDP